MICFKEKLSPQITEQEEEQIFSNWSTTSRQRLIEGNMRLALYVSKQFENALESEELVAISMVGLVKAANAFEPNKGIKFNTFASVVIKNEILMAIRKNRKTWRDISLYSPMGVDDKGNEQEIWETIGDLKSEKQMDRVEIQELIRTIREGLNEEERYVIAQWVDGVPQRKTAEILGVTQSRVSKLTKKAFEKLRKMRLCLYENASSRFYGCRIHQQAAEKGVPTF